MGSHALEYQNEDTLGLGTIRPPLFMLKNTRAEMKYVLQYKQKLRVYAVHAAENLFIKSIIRFLLFAYLSWHCGYKLYNSLIKIFLVLFSLLYLLAIEY